MKITINVTKKDIEKGFKFDIYSCPVARALNRKVKKRMSVGFTTFGLDNSKRFYLTPEAMDFIKKFDRGDTVNPIQLEVNIPANLLKPKIKR